jgi:Glutamyl-tRNAGlu reductase, dimerisation domain
MGNLQDSVHSVESIRAREVRRLLGKLSLSPEQAEAIENLSLSLVEELVRGPIAKTVILDPTSLVEADVGPGS